MKKNLSLQSEREGFNQSVSKRRRDFQKQLKIKYYDQTLRLEEIIKQISNRGYQIKNAIDWMKFQAGM